MNKSKLTQPLIIISKEDSMTTMSGMALLHHLLEVKVPIMKMDEEVEEKNLMKLVITHSTHSHNLIINIINQSYWMTTSMMYPHSHLPLERSRMCRITMMMRKKKKSTKETMMKRVYPRSSSLSLQFRRNLQVKEAVLGQEVRREECRLLLHHFQVSSRSSRDGIMKESLRMLVWTVANFLVWQISLEIVILSKVNGWNRLMNLNMETRMIRNL
mmetsp:Transcript_17057/g.24117  ORF Transcript_17057/g.24117 Transcript_17057/m.24117 type:complete len:214 (-) Transcript_17057:898-1539(-)